MTLIAVVLRLAAFHLALPILHTLPSLMCGSPIRYRVTKGSPDANVQAVAADSALGDRVIDVSCARGRMGRFRRRGSFARAVPDRRAPLCPPRRRPTLGARPRSGVYSD